MIRYQTHTVTLTITFYHFKNHSNTHSLRTLTSTEMSLKFQTSSTRTRETDIEFTSCCKDLGCALEENLRGVDDTSTSQDGKCSLTSHYRPPIKIHSLFKNSAFTDATRKTGQQKTMVLRNN